MLKTSKKNSKKIVAVIKNELTQAQMSQFDDEWATNPEPFLTLQEVLASQAAKQESKAKS